MSWIVWSVKLKCVFNSIISPEVCWCEILTLYLIADVQYFRTDANTSFKIQLVNQETIEKELNGLEDGKAVGLDGIPPKLLRLSASAISQSLTYLLNQSIKTKTFPDEWKTAKVVPLHKKAAHNLGKTLDLCLCYLLIKVVRKAHTHPFLQISSR